MAINLSSFNPKAICNRAIDFVPAILVLCGLVDAANGHLGLAAGMFVTALAALGFSVYLNITED
jgi:hypothetical protein